MLKIKNKTLFENFQNKIYFNKNSKRNTIHIGLVQLNTDHTLKSDWAKIINNQAVFFSSHISYCSFLKYESLNEISEGIKNASTLIEQGIKLYVMAFGCTSASIVINACKISNALTVDRNKIPTTNPWIATKAAIKYLKVKNVAILSPYTASINFILYKRIIEQNFKVSAFGSFNVKKDIEVTKITKNSIMNAINKLIKK
jgi:maleate isomerase